MTRKIGVVSTELPHNAHLQTHLSDSSIFWFAEVEALFAYLFHESLDEVLIDEKILKDPNSCANKYQKLMAQMHPNLVILGTRILEPQSLDQAKSVVYFPVLDSLFDNGELQSVFQPIVKPGMAGHQIIGFECLSRIRFENGIFTPEFLFNYAQEKLMLMHYDRLCLMQSLRLAPRFAEALIFVNVRPQTLISADFMSWFKALLKKNNLSPEQIVMEVTEQHCIISELEMESQCQELKSFGIKIAVDDFGSGISNLSMLEIMKPDFIKISGRFIKSSAQNVVKQKIIKNILDLAGDFKINAIVESVETKEEWLLAASLGAQFAQGFHFHRPMAQHELCALFG